MLHMFHKRQGQMEIAYCYFYTDTICEFKKLLTDDNLKLKIIESWQYLTEKKLIKIYSYVIMPNHIHGIIFIEGCENAETRCGVSQGNANKNEFSHLRKNSLSVIINQFKGSVTKWCNKNGFPDFQWQRLFYERIIRSDKDLFQIRKYIKENPLRWEFEKGYSDNLEL